MIPLWFLYLTGSSMLLLGILQLQQRPRDPDAPWLMHLLNVGTLWSIVCMVVGVALLAMALGYWHGPLGMEQPPLPSKRYH